MAVHAEWLHFAHLLILSHTFPFEQTGFIGFTRVQMRCVTTVSTLTLTLTDYVDQVPWSTKYIFKYIENSTFQLLTLL